MNRAKPRYLGSFFFSLGMTLFTLVWAPLCLLTYPLASSVRYRVITQWAGIMLWWLKLTCGIDCQIQGHEHIPTQATVVLCKHQSAFETLALQKLFIPHAWVLKRELLWIPFFGWSLALLNPIAIDRQASRGAIQQVLKQGKSRLEAEIHVVIFPEGTRVHPGQIGRYGRSGAMLAVRSQRMVIPVAHNAGEHWPRRGFLKYPGTINLLIGPPIDTQNRSADEVNKLARDWIEARMREISTVSLQKD